MANGKKYRKDGTVDKNIEKMMSLERR